MAEILSEFGHLVGLAGGNNIQATTMPTYSSVPLGTIVQYIGTTTADYINGYFYKATATGWEQHDTQPASNADNSVTAFKESSPALAAHAVDEYIRYNNVTYIVTAAIAIGDTLTVGTNIAVPELDEGTVIYTPEAGGGSSGGGHVIVNPSGTDMEQRASLQFVDANVTDDSTNDKTKIENVKVINSESELASASDGMYIGSYDDEADGVISADMVMYDSETTVKDELDNKVDKVTGKGLSTNDYDNIDKAKVGKIDETTTSISGNPISISGLKSNQLAINPVITLEPIQAGSGDPSPSNIRAISGYDKIEVLSGTKNLCGDLIDNTVIAYDSGIPVYNANYMCTDFIPVKAHTHYTITNASPGQENWVYHTDKTPWVRINDGVGTSIRHLYIGDDNDGYIRCSYQKSAASENKYLQIEVGQESTDYVPYNPQIKLQFGQTIYGGTLDVEKGILTVDKAIEIYDGSEDEAWDGSEFIHGIAISSNYQKSQTVIANAFKGVSPRAYSSLNTGEIALNTAYTGINAKYTISGLSDWKTYLVSNPLQVCYELATPYTIQLTPHEISLLKDYAYISTNGTNISFSYKNGEMASLGDVSQLGETVNALSNRCNYNYTDLGVDPSIDADDLTAPGIYSLYGSNATTQHLPVQNQWNIIHVDILNNNPDYVYQRGMWKTYTYYRSCTNGVWSAWTTLGTHEIGAVYNVTHGQEVEIQLSENWRIWGSLIVCVNQPQWQDCNLTGTIPVIILSTCTNGYAMAKGSGEPDSDTVISAVKPVSTDHTKLKVTCHFIGAYANTQNDVHIYATI